MVIKTEMRTELNVVCSRAVRVAVCRLLALAPELHVDTKQYQVRQYDSRLLSVELGHIW